MTTRIVELGNGLQMTVDERGDANASAGSGVLLLHGGAGSRSMAGLAAALSEHTYVLTATHPGFDGTPRVPWLDTVGDLADAYLDLLAELGLNRMMVIGNSFGGWVAAEMSLRDIDRRIASLVLLNATGVRPDRADQVTDIRQLPPQAIGKLAFFNPALRPDPAALTDQQRAGAAANQVTMARYAGDDFLFSRTSSNPPPSCRRSATSPTTWSSRMPPDARFQRAHSLDQGLDKGSPLTLDGHATLKGGWRT